MESAKEVNTNFTRKRGTPLQKGAFEKNCGDPLQEGEWGAEFTVEFRVIIPKSPEVACLHQAPWVSRLSDLSDGTVWSFWGNRVLPGEGRINSETRKGGKERKGKGRRKL